MTVFVTDLCPATAFLHLPCFTFCSVKDKRVGESKIAILEHGEMSPKIVHTYRTQIVDEQKAVVWFPTKHDSAAQLTIP